MTRPPGELIDEQLLEEIELLTEVISDVATRTCQLSQLEVDTVLGVDRPERGNQG